jgi:putative endonuclease
MTTKKSFGDYGETLAVQFLEQKGYVIVETKWHCRYGEIDIIARLESIWVFIEVKTRHGDKTENAWVGITPQKQQKFIRAVQMYQTQHNLDDITWRIDGIAVAIPRTGTPIIEHVEDAFDW